ncbi:hypothetical protein [Salirhabdus salicampi]|uniref:hypothetical protein n=1 Tax=Salirhabdus salicampi TaxID=476102 RepID=UPI0020C2C8AC|nr:hypothetical protein [Salirhabdus salicampi]MCP8615274.1 hypothetical protein [Salirhabdus salicampi]
MAGDTPDNQGKSENIPKKRLDSMCNHFIKVKGKRAFFLISQYPFMLIGTVKDVFEDYVEIEADTSIIDTFEQRNWFIHIDTIQTFYDEEEGGPKIPTLN